MRKDKSEIFELRKQGKSYREIQIITGVSRSTLSEWFKHEKWSLHLARINRKNQLSPESIKKLHEGRKKALINRYNEMESSAIKEFDDLKDNPLFIAGLMIYAGEGDKAKNSLIRVANIDFCIHKIFINFLKTFFKASIGDIKVGLIIYPDIDLKISLEKWHQELGIPLSNFHKPIVILGKHKTKRLHFGVASTILVSSFLKRKLFVWLDLSKNYLISK